MNTKLNQTQTLTTPGSDTQTLAEFASAYGEIIHYAYRLRCGISGWYKQYLVSSEFDSLTPEFKKDSFEAYDGLTSMLDYLEIIGNQNDEKNDQEKD